MLEILQPNLGPFKKEGKKEIPVFLALEVP